ncbi:MAG: hypothetical protein HC812_09070 [Leptolyngbya sp. RL_3_1]|nr:hypothetical protein [Leptolyngbya sp. RL_3_1]
MSTTDLFVELLIIGVGAAIGLFLLVLTVFGYGWLAWDGLLSLPALLPILAIVYVLGIVVDRFSDRLFEKSGMITCFATITPIDKPTLTIGEPCTFMPKTWLICWNMGAVGCVSAGVGPLTRY